MTNPSEIPLNVIDDMFALSESADEPWSVHVEARVAGTLDETRLSRAISSALAKHPLARARLVEHQKKLLWSVDAEPTLQVLSACETQNDTQLDAVRAEFLSTVIPLAASPPLRARLVRRDLGDHLILSAHHAACDGMGALRLMQSIARAALDGIERFRDALTPATRVAPHGKTGRGGYGVHVRAMPLAPVVQSEARRSAGATVNDVLVAAVHRAVERWNDLHEVASDRLSVAVPINARGRHQQPALVGNFALADTVSTRRSDRTSVTRTLTTVHRQTQRFKDAGAPFADLVAGAAGWPTWLARRAPWIFGARGSDGVGDCAVLSNLGRADAVQSFGADLPVTGFWFSPPIADPISVALGVASSDDSLFLTLRFRWSRLDEAAARQFMDLIVEQMNTGGGG
jgi:NRPS condensation-like uncharacterized protein